MYQQDLKRMILHNNTLTLHMIGDIRRYEKIFNSNLVYFKQNFLPSINYQWVKQSFEQLIYYLLDYCVNYIF